MSGSSSSQFSTSATSTAPWADQAGHLRQLFARAEQLYGQGPYQNYPGQSVATFDPATQRALGMVERRAEMGDPTVRAAAGEVGRTLGGKYLNPASNPWLARYADIGQRNISRGYYDTVNALGSRLEAAGRTGSGVHANLQGRADEALATGLGDFNAQLYGGAYDAERGRMANAVGAALPLSEAAYRDANAMRAVGGQREAQTQREIDDLIMRFQQTQRGGAEKLGELAQFLGAPIMSSSGMSYGRGDSTSVSLFG